MRKSKSTPLSKPVSSLSKNECRGDLIPIRTGNYDLAFDPKAERLVITIDLSAAAQSAARPSKSGKTRVLATTSGFVIAPAPGVEGLQLSLTATLPSRA